MFDIIAVPFGYLLSLIYDFVGNYGLSIVIFTIISKALMYPLQFKSKVSMRQMQKLNPQLQDLQKKYANNKEKYQQEVSALYQKEKVNPAGSCLPTLITLPIMMGLYYVIQQPLSYLFGLDTETITKLAEVLNVTIPDGYTITRMEIQIAEAMNQNLDLVSQYTDKFTGIDFNFICFDLSKTPDLWPLSILILLPIISGLTSYAMMFLTQKLQGTSMEGQPSSMKTMIYLMPLMSVYFAFILPAGVTVYWITGNIYALAQEVVMSRHLNRMDVEKEEAETIVKNRESENRRREMEIKKEEQRRISKENLENNNKKG